MKWGSLERWSFLYGDTLVVCRSTSTHPSLYPLGKALNDLREGYAELNLRLAYHEHHTYRSHTDAWVRLGLTGGCGCTTAGKMCPNGDGGKWWLVVVGSAIPGTGGSMTVEQLLRSGRSDPRLDTGAPMVDPTRKVRKPA